MAEPQTAYIFAVASEHKNSSRVFEVTYDTVAVEGTALMLINDGYRVEDIRIAVSSNLKTLKLSVI